MSILALSFSDMRFNIQGRKDDVWSLLYMLIEMHCGLPWQKDKDKRVIEMKKLNVPDKVLLMHMPGDERLAFQIYSEVAGPCGETKMN